MEPEQQTRGEVVGPKKAAEQLLSEGDIPAPEEYADEQEGAQSWEELIVQLLTVWNSVAKPRLPVWVFSETEIRALSGAWAPVAEKYGGPALSIEAAAVLVTASVVLPRAAVTYRRKKAGRPPEHGKEETEQSKEEKYEGQTQDPQVLSVETLHNEEGTEDEGSGELFQDELPRE